MPETNRRADRIIQRAHAPTVYPVKMAGNWKVAGLGPPGGGGGRLLNASAPNPTLAPHPSEQKNTRPPKTRFRIATTVTTVGRAAAIGTRPPGLDDALIAGLRP